MKRTVHRELLIAIDRAGDEPLRVQIEREIRSAIASGRLIEGSTLPSTRALAASLGVSRGVVLEAYEQLVAEERLESRRGSGTRVAAATAVVRPPSVPHRTTSPGAFRYDFRLGVTDAALFPATQWIHAMRRAFRAAPPGALARRQNGGNERTREVLAAHLNRVRATAATPDSILICTSRIQALRVVCAALRESGFTTIAIEAPALGAEQAALEAEGLVPITIPVDDEGLRIHVLEHSAAAAVIVSPAHQEPSGAILSPARRAALVSWAKKRGAFIVEQDDCGAEYRYGGQGGGALQGLAPDHVAYLGGATYTLSPGLGLAWLILPDLLFETTARLTGGVDGGSSIFDQLTLAEFCAGGDFDRHIRKTRAIFRRRRDRIIQAVRMAMPDLRLAGSGAGVHVTVELPADVQETAIVRAAAAQSIGITAAALYRPFSNRESPAIALSYAGVAENDINDGIRRLAGIVSDSSVYREVAGTTALEFQSRRSRMLESGVQTRSMRRNR